jgi:hypothetical protein
MTMKKLRLDLDHLAVESFATAGVADERGTVAANAATLPTCTLQPSFGNTACDVTWHCTLPGGC